MPKRLENKLQDTFREDKVLIVIVDNPSLDLAASFWAFEHVCHLPYEQCWLPAEA